jgi:phosphoribosylformylglycinamidine synthase
MVGRLPDARRAGRLGFQGAGEQIALVGSFSPSLAAGELEKLRGRPLPDGLPDIDIDAVRAAQIAVRDAVRAGTLSSAHDIAEGGLAIALAECCLAGEVGASVLLKDDFWETIRPDAPGPRSSSPVSALVTAALFGEGAGGFIVSAHGDALRELGKRAPVLAIGTVGGEELRIEAASGAAGEAPNGEAAAIAVSLSELAAAHSSLAELFG